MPASEAVTPDPLPPIPDLLRLRARERPDAVVFVFAGESLTHGELLRDASALARELIVEGVRPGDRLALLLPAGLGFVRAFYAAHLAGAAPCALAPRLGPRVLARRLARLRPALVLADEVATEARAAADPSLRFVTLQELAARGSVEGEALALPPSPRPGSIVHLQLTSGTSGEPRVVQVASAAVATYLATARVGLGVTAEDRMVVWVPPWHDLGLFYGIVFPIAFGCTSYLVEPAIATIGLWLRTISEARGTLTGAPDFAYRIACRTVEPAGIDLSSLRGATNGGEPVRLSTIEAFERRFGLRHVVRAGYGLAEATLGVSWSREATPPRADAAGNVSNGAPMAGVEVRIVDEADRDLPAGSIGEILVRTGALMSGYLDAPEETAAALRGGWLHTGDAGKLDERGELYVIGRRRTLLKRAGSALAPRELEEVAESVAGVRLSAAVARGEGIALIVESKEIPGEEARALARAVGERVRAQLAFVPDVLVVPPRTIARSENGKLRHQVLRERLEGDALPILFDSASG